MPPQDPPLPPLPAGRPVPARTGLTSLRAIAALILREMATRYGRSPGGYVWAVLEPAAGIALLSLVFSVAFRTPALGVSFPIFYATGMVPFLMFMAVQNAMAAALTFSKPLLAYPKVTFLDALLARFALNLVTQLLVGYIILTGCVVLFETRVTPDLPTIVEAFALTALLGLGIGTLNCFLQTRFAIWQQAWSILTRPLFIVSCIFFLFETIPRPYSDYLWYNPLVHVVGLMRRGFYGSYDAPYVSPVYLGLVSLVCLAAGLLLLRRYHSELLDR